MTVEPPTAREFVPMEDQLVKLVEAWIVKLRTPSTANWNWVCPLARCTIEVSLEGLRGGETVAWAGSNTGSTLACSISTALSENGFSPSKVRMVGEIWA